MSNQFKKPISALSIALAVPVLTLVGCSTLLGGDVTDRLIKADSRVGDKFADFKKRYCELSIVEKTTVASIVNRPQDAEKIAIRCPFDNKQEI